MTAKTDPPESVPGGMGSTNFSFNNLLQRYFF